MLKVGEKIKKVRELRGYTQEHMAHSLGITQAAYSKLEKDENRINLDRLEEVAKLLEMEVADILTFDEKKVFHSISHNQTGGETKSGIFYMDSKLIANYEETITHLKEEIKVLRKEKADLLELLKGKLK